MDSLFKVSNVVCHDALPADQFLGLLCYASCQLGYVRLDSLQVRRGTNGAHFTKWPTRKDAAGFEHPYVEFVDPGLRAQIKAKVESAVLAVAKREGRLS